MPKATDKRSREELLAENEELRFRLEEAEETLHAIRSGEVDALVVSGPDGEQIFTLEGAEHPYRVLVESMSEGAVTLDSDGVILYCNKRLATMLQVPMEKLIGTPLTSYVAPLDAAIYAALREKCLQEQRRDEIRLITGTGAALPVQLSCRALEHAGKHSMSAVITDLSEQKRNEEIIASGKLAYSIITQAGEAIIVCDENGNIMRSSRLAQQLSPNCALSMPFDEAYPLLMHDATDLFSINTILHGEISQNVEVILKGEDDQTHYLLLNARPLTDQQEKVVGCVVTLTDFTEQKQAKERMKISLQEKEVLLKEIHHRVKNNLQVISSLVSLQAATIETPEVRGLFQDVQNRLRSMSLLHEKLYQSEHLSGVEFAEYGRSLLQSLWRAHRKVEADIRLRLEMQPVLLPMESAVPCGLILNELVTNALKHAFIGRSAGEVTVGLQGDEAGRVSLSVADNGVGIPPGQNWRQASSLGLRLVQMLAGQLNASVEMKSGNGTEFRISFGLKSQGTGNSAKK